MIIEWFLVAIVNTGAGTGACGRIVAGVVAFLEASGDAPDAWRDRRSGQSFGGLTPLGVTYLSAVAAFGYDAYLVMPQPKESER